MHRADQVAPAGVEEIPGETEHGARVLVSHRATKAQLLLTPSDGTSERKWMYVYVCGVYVCVHMPGICVLCEVCVCTWVYVCWVHVWVYDCMWYVCVCVWGYMYVGVSGFACGCVCWYVGWMRV